MADNYLEKTRESYEQRKAAWLKKVALKRSVVRARGDVGNKNLTQTKL